MGPLHSGIEGNKLVDNAEKEPTKELEILPSPNISPKYLNVLIKRKANLIWGNKWKIS